MNVKVFVTDRGLRRVCHQVFQRVFKLPVVLLFNVSDFLDFQTLKLVEPVRLTLLRGGHLFLAQLGSWTTKAATQIREDLLETA